MASSTLFIISTLALLGAAAAQYCSSDSQGILFGEPIPFMEIIVAPGPNTVSFPNPCTSSSLVGLKVTTCSDYPSAPGVQVLDLQHAYVDSSSDARVDGVAYCRFPGKPAAGVLKPPGHHHSQIMLAHNLFQ